MTEPGSKLRTVGSTDLASALAAALDGGPVVAPLPSDPVERRRALAVLRPDRPVTEPDAAVVVTTSGSTGRPKAAVLSRSAIRASVEAAHNRLGGPGDWVLALPGHYVAGLMVLARTVLSKTRTWPVRSDLRDLPATVAHLSGRRYLSLVPTQLSRARRQDRVWEALAAFDAVLLGGGRTDAGLLAHARASGIPVVPTYGMSETCGGCVYDGKPLDGVGVRVGAQGRISLAGPVLFDGYAGDAAATVQVLRDGWFLTSDVGRIDDDGRLVVLGRADDVVVSGGVNVALPAVTQALAGLSGIRDAAAVGVPDDEWGTRVVACLVGSVAPTISDVRDHVAAVLPRTWAPRAVVLVDALPLLANGKLDRLALQRIAADAGP